MQIHPTAIVDPLARLDSSVSVGAYSLIGAHVTIGAGTTVGPHCVIEGNTNIGRVPLHTLRADIDYGFGEAKTTYGVIGIKVWVYKGETVGKAEQAATVPGSAPEEVPVPKKVRKSAAATTRTDAAATKNEGETKPKSATRARKKPVSGDAAKAEDASTSAVEAATEDPAKTAAKVKSTVRRVSKKTGA